MRQAPRDSHASRQVTLYRLAVDGSPGGRPVSGSQHCEPESVLRFSSPVPMNVSPGAGCRVDRPGKPDVTFSPEHPGRTGRESGSMEIASSREPFRGDAIGAIVTFRASTGTQHAEADR